MDTEHPIQFTGIVVTYNEERRLRECLNSLAFCEQLLVIDLGSEDDSVKIAQECGAEVVRHERVEIVERIRQETMTYARNDWVVRANPDEVLPSGVEDHIRSLIQKDSDLGLIQTEYQYYFRGKPLHCTFWGRGIKVPFVYHKRRVKFSSNVHRGIELLADFSSTTLSRQSVGCVTHYWVDSYRELFEKHWRYIRHEGKSRYNSGQRFSWGFVLRNTYGALKDSLIKYRGLCGGFTGIFLSFFYSWYVFMSWLSLRQYEKHQQILEEGNS